MSEMELLGVIDAFLSDGITARLHERNDILVA